MRSSQLILFSLCVCGLIACGSKRVISDPDAAVTKNEFVSLKMNWLKDKGAKYDLEMMVSNISQNDIIIMLNDLSCSKGGVTGSLKHTFFNTGERTIDFRSGQTKKFRMVCDLGTKSSGPYKIAIHRIYDNPNADGATKGNVLGTPIEWTGQP